MAKPSAIADADFAAILESVVRFTRERLIPAEREVAEGDEPPPSLVAEMRELGLFGLTFPVEYGGLGLNPVQYAEVGLELGRVAPAIRNLISIHNGVASSASCLRELRRKRIAISPVWRQEN